MCAAAVDRDACVRERKRAWERATEAPPQALQPVLLLSGWSPGGWMKETFLNPPGLTFDLWPTGKAT